MHTLRIFLAPIAGIIVFAFLFITAVSVHAQFQAPGVPSAHIELSPTYPRAGEPFTARLADYGSQTNDTVSWLIDGVLLSDKQRVIELTAPLLGVPMTIEARITTSGGATESTRIVAVPSDIDIITESNTTAPYFYKGRRTPSTGSDAHLVVIPHLFSKKGTRIPTSEVEYTWSINNNLVNTDRKDDTLDTTLSSVGDSLVRITADAPAYGVRYEKTFTIESGEPQLAFYVYNALTGLSQNAIQDNYTEAVREISVRAQPYFMDRNVYRNVEQGWSINGERTQNSGGDQEFITLQSGGNGGVTDVGYSIRNLSALSQYAANLFRIAFK